VLLGDSSKARKALGWEPQIPLDALIKETVDADFEQVIGHASESGLAAQIRGAQQNWLSEKGRPLL